MALKTRYYNGGEKPVREVLSRHPYLVHNEKVISFDQSKVNILILLYCDMRSRLDLGSPPMWPGTSMSGVYTRDFLIIFK